MANNPTARELSTLLGQGGSIQTLGANAAVPTEPPAFVVPILLEDGTQRAVVVDERWTRTKDPMPLMTTEQANAMAKLLNEEWHEKQEEIKKKRMEQYRLYIKQMLMEKEKEEKGKNALNSQQKWVDKVKQQYNDWRKGK